MTQEELWLLNEKWHGEKTEGFFADCERLRSGEPLAYIIGSIPFLHMTIYLDSHPLIPRAETEYWVNAVIPQLRVLSPAPRILDLCAGSGCIGVAVQSALPHSHVDFVEIDTSHHATIAKNCAENGVSAAHIRILGGDLFTEVRDVYDAILSNPPYIDKALGRTDESVLLHEPHTALFGGARGLALIEHIIQNAGTHLTPEGSLYIEHEPEQTEQIHAFGATYGFALETHNDQYGVPRYTHLTRTLGNKMAS